MQWKWVVLGSVAVLVFVGLAGMRRRERSPSGYWIGGWIAASLGGLLSLLSATRPELAPASFPVGGLFGWFLLAGAFVLAEQPVAAWLLPLGAALGVLRGALAGLGFPVAAHLSGLVIDLSPILAAAWLARRAVPAEAPTAAQRLMPAAFVALAATGGLHLWWQAGGEPQEWILTLWMFATPPLLGLQLRVAAEWTRRHLVRAQRDLEHRVAERTAELARVNETLRRSEERYRTVSDLGTDLSFGFRVFPDGRVVGEWVTDAFGRMTGFEMHEMTGDRWLALIHPEDRASLERSFRTAVKQGTVTLSFRIVGKDGTVRWLEARERVERDAEGLRVVGAARDVTEARQNEEERFRLERQFQETQRLESLGLVTGGIAHDFNNLLTVILGNGRLALSELPADHPLRPRLERVLSAAELGAGLTEQMLVYAGRAPRARKPVELSTLVADMLDLARASLPGGVTLADQLGAGVWVEGDETQLRQIVLNLIANAGEAIGERSGRVLVRTALAEVSAEELAGGRGAGGLEAGLLALLEVVDDGAGMDVATRERVFEPFFTTKLSGRGLGLAAVLGIVRGHRGCVVAESTPGQGSRFRVYLPPATQGERVAPPLRGRAHAGAARGRILVIDDQEPVLELAREFFGRAGYQVETAQGGREGLERFRAAPRSFAALVLDLAMPDLAGTEVGRAVRALRADVPLLLVSGYDADLAAVHLASLQPARVLRKPYEREELVGALEQLLAAAGARRAE